MSPTVPVFAANRAKAVQLGGVINGTTLVGMVDREIFAFPDVVANQFYHLVFGVGSKRRIRGITEPRQAPDPPDRSRFEVQIQIGVSQRGEDEVALFARRLARLCGEHLVWGVATESLRTLKVRRGYVRAPRSDANHSFAISHCSS